MSRAFADTSALIALLVKDDARHEDALRVFDRLEARGAALVTTSYVLIETYALLASRHGRDAVRRFRADFAPLLDVRWVDAALHEEGLDLLCSRARHSLSLVDCVSFIVAHERDIGSVFAFDRHFDQEGFAVLR